MGRALAVVIAIPVVASGAVLATFFLSSREEEGGLSARCAEAAQVRQLSLADAGQIVATKGTVEGVRSQEDGVLLDLGSAFPDQDLTVLIRDSSLENWTLPPQEQYAGREIAFAGKAVKAGDSLQIEARFPGDLEVCS